MNERLAFLIEQYLAGNCTEIEKKEVEAWYASFEQKNDWLKHDEPNTQKVLQLMLQEIQAQVQTPQYNLAPARVVTLRGRKFWKVAVAAALILLGGSAWYYYNETKDNIPAITESVDKHLNNDAMPGGSYATLTLADGSKIVLNAAANGSLAKQGNTKIIKLDSSRLAYAAAEQQPRAVLYNTVTTPNGGQYEIILADETKIWLNAASSLRFPTSFGGKDRTVELTGEGYFEVAHNASMPFHVKINRVDVQVLGTHFNINAYSNEATVKTTLLEGAVKISSGTTTSSLKPGERAEITAGGSIKIARDMHIEEAVAWKDGLFSLNSADVPTVMRQLARWYDVEIVYDGAIPKGNISGDISRYMNLSKVLQVLELSNIHCRIEGRKIIVTP